MRILKLSSSKLGGLAALAASVLSILNPLSRAQTFEPVLTTNLFQPTSVSVSPQNRYIISDTANHRIVQFNPDNRAFAVVAGPERAPFEAGAVDGQRIDARFRNPQGVLCVGDLIYVADAGNHAIREIDAAGNVRTLAGDLARAHEVDAFGGLPDNWGSTDGPLATALFNAPSGLASDGAGKIYVADSGNHSVRLIDLNNGTVSTVVRAGLSTPVALALAPDGTLFIADSGAHSIKIWRPGDTRATLVAGGGSPLARGYRDSGIALNALFSTPIGIYYRETTDELIVADSGNKVLRSVIGVSGPAPKVETFANTSAAGFKTPIGVTRDPYGVFLVADSTANALNSVITVRFPRIERPQVGYIHVYYDQEEQMYIARLVPVTDQTFDNLVQIAISGDTSAQHHFSNGTSDNQPVPPPSTSSQTSRDFPGPIAPAPAWEELKQYALNQTVPPRFNFRIKAFSAPKSSTDERIASLTTEAVFRFKCATPFLDSQSTPGRLVFHCNTTNAIIYYTTDGSEPDRGASESVKFVRSGDSIPLIVTTNSFVVKARAYNDANFLSSEVAKAEFSPENFVPNRIGLGFEDGEASSLMRAAPGQRYFAPVTLSLMPNAQAYGLQFNLSIEPEKGPVSADYQLDFQSTLVEKGNETNRVIPPAVFVLAGTNFVTNLVDSIATNYTYQVTITNFSPTPTTNYVSFTNKLAEVATNITSITITNLGQSYQVPVTNYITNSFQFVADNSRTNTTDIVDTNYLYQHVALGVTNIIQVDSELEETTPLIVTNFISNLGRLFSFTTTNYITNSFNLLSSEVVRNQSVISETNYTYLAVTPGVTNFVFYTANATNPPPRDFTEIIVTNFVTNLGQAFPVISTNILTNAFDIVSVSVSSNPIVQVESNYRYRSVTPGTTNYVRLDEPLKDSTAVVVTNLVSNLGQLFPVLSTNYISNAFNLVSISDVVERSTNFTTNFVYEVTTPSRTDTIILDRVLADSTRIVTTNLVENMGESFPVLVTNFVENEFFLVSATTNTEIVTNVVTDFLYEAVTPAKTTTVIVDSPLADNTPVYTTNVISNLGQQFPVVTTNYISNSFNLFAVDFVTETNITVLTNFEYRAVTPAKTNIIAFTNILGDSVPVVTAEFVTNLGQAFPIFTTNYISNSFNLLTVNVTTNVKDTVSTNFEYRAVNPASTNFFTLNSFLENTVPVVVTNFIANLGQLFPVARTNYLTNGFELMSAELATNISPSISTSLVYRFVTPGTSNYLNLDYLLPDRGPVVLSVTRTNLGVNWSMVSTNIAENVFDLVSVERKTNLINSLYYEYYYPDLALTNVLVWPTQLPDNSIVVTTNTFTVGALSATTVVTNVIGSGADYSGVIVWHNEVQYQYSLPAIVSAGVFRFTNALPVSTNIDVSAVGYVAGLDQPFSQRYFTRYANPLSEPITNSYASLEIRTNALYRLKTPALTNYITLSTNLPDVAPVVTTTAITNLGQTYSMVMTNFATNVFDLVSTTYSTNYSTNIATNVVYRSVTPATTNHFSLTSKLPDEAPVLTTVFVTNLNQVFPAISTNYVPNTFDYLGERYSTNRALEVLTNATYVFVQPAVTNVLRLNAKLPDMAPVITTTFLTNLGQVFPVTSTNWVANWFEFLGQSAATNSETVSKTNFTYAFITPALTNYVLWPELLPDTVEVVTTNFISNLGRQFPVRETNYVNNTFRLIGTSWSTNAVTNVTPVVVYEFPIPATTNYVFWPELLPAVKPVVTTNFVSNLGQLFPFAVTNFVTNTFRLVGTFVDPQVTEKTGLEVLYALITPPVTNFFDLPEPLPASITVVTTNFISNLGQQFPVLVTNIVQNSFQLVSATSVTNVTPWANTNYVYALVTPGITNVVTWPAKLPDSVTLVTTNFINNLGQLFPVTSTNRVFNLFTLVGTNIDSRTIEDVRTNIFYEFHTPSITNLFSVNTKLPDFVQVITTNFVTNLGQLFPVLSTNRVQNEFELVSTNYTTNQVIDIELSYLYAIVTPGTGPQTPASVSTNLLTLDAPLQEVVPIVTFVGTVTNLNQVFSVFTTNYVTNSFKLVSQSFVTNKVEISRTNAPSVFADLIMTNPSQSWMAVGWIERFGQTNLYNTKVQNLLSYSQPHNSLFLGNQGEAVAGAFSFIVPVNAVSGDSYKLRVSRPSATADGVSQDMFIQTPDENDTNSPVKAIRKLVVTNRVSYIAGDVSEFRWFNAGEFGDTNIANNDLTVLLGAIVYGLNQPPADSDFADAMDTCCYTIDGRDLSSMEFAGVPVDIDEIAFGDGSRPAPLGNRPFARLEVNDLFVAYRRSLDPTTVWYERYWSNGVRQARIYPNTFRGSPTTLTRQGTVKALGVAPDPNAALTVYAGTASGLPGTTVAVPIRARVDGNYPLRTLMFNARVETPNGTSLDTFIIEATATDALGTPTRLLNDGPAVSGAVWLDASKAGVLGDKVIARVLFTIPADANPSSVYYVKLDRISGSPNGISLFPVRTGNGIISMANRPTPVWNDGIPDAWRQQYFGSSGDARSAAVVDADGDGLSNYEEYKLGTNPMDAADDLRIRASANGRGVNLKFHTTSGKMYRIEGSTNLDVWFIVQPNVPGTGAELELPAPGGAHSFYYRVRLQE